MRASLRVAGLVFLTACGGAFPEARRIPPATMIAGGYAFPDVATGDAQPPASPIGLTASDGTGLRLAALEARALVDDPLAFTELHLTFDNPEDRRLEGTFTITLPEGAALSRFAMRLGDVWQEGEVVEKQAARQAYEDFLHRRQDPALLEQAAGNQFSARVFPIPPRGRKELIVSYSQEIKGGQSWSLPLRGLPELGRLDVTVTRAADRDPLASLHREGVTPEADFTLDPGLLGKSPGLRSGNLVLARVRPLPEVEPDPLGATLVLVDTSGSRALGFAEETRLVDALVRRLATGAGAATRVTVAAFDQTTDSVFEGAAGAWGAADLRRLRARQAFGASDLGRALGWAAGQAAQGYPRVVLIGDGVATAGETAAAELGALAAKLAGAGVERLDVVAIGGIRDDATLKKLATAGLPRDGIVADAALGAEAIAARLSLRTHSGIPVEVEGARFSWPTRLDGVQAGDEVLVYADMPEGQPVRVRVGERTGPALDLATAARPLLERTFARARIESLLAHQGATPDVVLQREVIALSTRHRVLSPYTSLLVLETEQDFARFAIDRRALGDILMVNGGTLAVVDRRLPPPPTGAAADARLRLALGGSAAPTKPSAPRLKPPPPPPPTQRAPLDEGPRVSRLDSAPAARPAAPPPAPSATGAPSAPTTPWAPPPDAASARGNMWGESVGDSFGAGGLGLAGIGEGGGGRGEGIGLGQVGTLGHGAGPGTSGQGAASGFGSGHGRLGGAHRTSPPTVRSSTSTVSGRIAPETIHAVVRRSFAGLRRCYEAGLGRDPNLAGRAAVRFSVGRDGAVATVTVDGELDAVTNACLASAFRGLTFPAPEGGVITVTYPLTFSPGDGAPPPSPERRVDLAPTDVPAPAAPAKASRVEAYTGRFKAVMDTVAAGGARAAVESAFAWHREAPGDVMALVALGEALEAAREPQSAARAYGSIVDLFPARADLRRFAGERLERVAGGAALALAIDTFTKAEEQRPDHPASHRLLAFADLRRGDFAGAFAAAARGLAQRYPPGRFRGVEQILREDLGLIAAAWIKAEPSLREEILARLHEAGGTVEDEPSLRFVLGWETDANDVDFHIEDAEGGHAYYRTPELPSGGRLYADVTTGYGPECFTIRLPAEKRSAHYKLMAHYYARGPMGYGMGKLEILDHDGKGGIAFQERPFVVMADRAFVDLGTVER
jgi:tetratricopeptide (TPR) repeat protein